MRKLTSSMTAMVLLAACGPHLPPDRPIAPPLKTKGYEYTFPSGLRLVDYEDTRSKEFMIDVSYGIGGRDEKPGQYGLAHLAEHMAFKGKQRGPDSPKIWERVFSAGVEFNAFTTSDNTDYWEIGKPEQFNNMVALEAERMRDPLANVPESEFLSEREVVVSEYRQRLETSTEGMQFGWLSQNVFAGSPYGQEVAGSVDSLRAMKFDDVRNWYKNNYRPDNAIIVITGPKPFAEVVRFVGAAFGSLAKGDGKPHAPAARPVPPFPADPPENAPIIQKHAPIEQPTLWTAWTVPGVYAADYPKGFVAARLLTRLLQFRFDDDHRVDDVGCDFIPFDGVGMIACQINLEKEDDATAVNEAVKDQLINFVEAGPELHMAVNFMRGQLLNELYLSVEQIDASPIAQYLRATDNPDYLDGYQKQVNDALDGDISAYAYKYLNRKRTVSMLVAPEKNVLVQVKDEAAPKVGEAFDNPDEQTNLHLTPAEVVNMAGKPGLDQVQTKTLDNGLKVMILKRGTIPVVDVRLIVDTPITAPGQASRALRQVELNASWRGFEESTQTHWQKIGAQPIVDNDNEHIVFGGRATSGNLPHILADVSWWLENAEPEANTFESEQRRAKAEQTAADKRPRDRGLAIMRANLFPGHPYGKITTAADFENLDRGEADKWLRGVLRPDRSTLVITGDVDVNDDVWKEVNDWVGKWKAPASAPLNAPPALFANARKIVVVNRARATQAEIFVALAMAPPDATQSAAIRAMTWYARKQLTKVLREKQGVTYGVNAFERPLAQADIFGIQAAVDQSATARALTEFLAMVQQFRDKPLDDQIVQQAQWTDAREYSMAFDQVSTAAEAMQTEVEHHRASDYYEKYPEALGNLSAATIQATAQDLRVGNESVVVIGDKDVLVPQLKGAGFEVEVAPEPKG